jgi:hypothetical protein
MKKVNKKQTLTKNKQRKRALRAKNKARKLNILRGHRKHEKKLEKLRMNAND